MRIYIAGPMTGMAQFNYPAFRAAAQRLRDAGAAVVSPVEIGERYGSADEINADAAKLNAVIEEELRAIPDCDAIFLLRGWQRSRGAKAELMVALKNDLEILVEG